MVMISEWNRPYITVQSFKIMQISDTKSTSLQKAPRILHSWAKHEVSIAGDMR